MALPGLRSTADFGADERPRNWREGLLLRSPRNGAPLFSLTAAMRSEATNDPEFKWWDEDVDLMNFQLNGAVLIGATTMIVDALATRLTAGDMLKHNVTGEALQVVSITSDTTFEVMRAVGAPATPSGTAVAMADNTVLTYIGSAYREGAPKALGTSFNPTSHSNVTQIFRTPVDWTRTAMKTRVRSVKDVMAEDRRRSMHKHALGIERAFWLGTRYETMEQGQPKRYTGGVIDAIPAANIRSVAGGGALDMATLISYFPDIFAYGSSEKLAFTSLATMSTIGEVLRKNSSIQMGPSGEKEFGMNVKRVYTPAGTLVLTEHPLFGNGNSFLSNSLTILDTANLRYRYITDTTLLKDREPAGTDGKGEEYLTEAGLEYHHPTTMFQIKNIVSAAKDV